MPYSTKNRMYVVGDIRRTGMQLSPTEIYIFQRHVLVSLLCLLYVYLFSETRTECNSPQHLFAMNSVYLFLVRNVYIEAQRLLTLYSGRYHVCTIYIISPPQFI